MTFDDLKKLRLREHRDQAGLYFAEGEHLVLELLRALPDTPKLGETQVFVTHEYESEKLLHPWPAQLPLQRLSARQMAALSDTRSPQGIIAVVPMVETPEISEPSCARWHGSGTSDVCCRRKALICTTRRSFGPAWAPYSVCPSNGR